MTGCGTYRCIAVAAAVRKIRPEWRIELYKPGALKMNVLPDGKLQAIRGLEDLTGVDLIVTQRVGKSGSVQFLAWMQRHGTAIVVDADDAMWCIDRSNVAWKSWNNEVQHWRFMDEASRLADLTTVTTAALAKRYGKHGRVEILPNRVPSQVLGLPSIRTLYPPTVTVGWSGFTATHPTDLPVVGDAVAQVVAKHEVAVRIVGDGKGVAEAWGLDPVKVEPTGGVPMERYHTTLTCLDVMLVPLADTPFNRAKSDLKAREAMTMGIPTIASPTPANRALAKVSPLMLASSRFEWRSYLDRLVGDPEYRARKGAESRDAMAGQVLEEHAEMWAQAWERAAVRRSRLAAV